MTATTIDRRGARLELQGHLIGKRPRWMDAALCADADPDLFHLEPKQDNSRRIAAAVRICACCRVRLDCLRWALETGDTWAILGGKTPHQRTRMLNGRKAQ